jgi:hypothetical protein
MKDKYPVTCYYGIPVDLDNSGHYMFKSELKIHAWRNGKHTKGKFQKPGQLFLTENNLMVAIVATANLKFNNRHTLVPLERFTKEFIPNAMLQTAQSAFEKEDH